MGGAYLNDFNRFGRTWQVKVQADAVDRKGVDDIFRVRVRTAQGDLVPLRAVADVRLITAPSSIVRYNNLRSVTVNGGPAPGYSSGEAIAAMEEACIRQRQPDRARLFLARGEDPHLPGAADRGQGERQPDRRRFRRAPHRHHGPLVVERGHPGEQ